MYLTTLSQETDSSLNASTKRIKTKPGCVTCKARCIKFDEGKPECLRYPNSKRRCGGYGTRRSSSSRRSSEASNRSILAKADESNEYTSSPMFDEDSRFKYANSPGTFQILPFYHSSETSDENCLLRWFRLRSLPDLWDLHYAGNEGEMAWKKGLLQSSGEVPVIRHAVLAIASMHGNLVAEGLTSSRATGPNSFALQHYNQAINQLSFLIDDQDAHSISIALIASLLLVVIELLQNNSSKAVLHLRGCLQILDSCNHLGASTDLPCNYSLYRLLTRLRTEVASFEGFGSSVRMVQESHLPNFLASKVEFTNITEASDMLYSILSGIYIFFESVTPAMTKILDTTIPLSSSAAPNHKVHTNLLSHWINTFTKFKAKYVQTLVSQDLVCALLLDSLAATTSIKLTAYLTPSSEVAYDAFIGQFRLLLPPLEALVRAQAAPQHLFHLTAGIPTIQPLYFISTKCRDPSLRRSAIALLRASRVRQGIWDGPEMAMVAQKLMSIEEEGREISTAEGVTEGMRAHRVRVEMSDGNGLKKEAIIHFWKLKKGGRKEWEKREETVIF